MASGRSLQTWIIYQDIFTFGIDHAERMLDIIQIPFWTNVLSLKVLWRCPVTKEGNDICFTPLWYNETLRLPLKPKWLKRGISIIADLIDEYFALLSMEDFHELYSILTHLFRIWWFNVNLKIFLR